MARRRAHSQPRIPGTPRIPTGTSLIPELRERVEREAARYGVSKSWITAIALAKHFDLFLPEEADYRNQPWNRRRQRKSKG